MTPRFWHSARALAPLLVLVSCFSRSRAFFGVTPPRAGRTSTAAGRCAAATRGVRNQLGGERRGRGSAKGTKPGFPKHAPNGLRSSADDDGQGGSGGVGGGGEEPGMFGGRADGNMRASSARVARERIYALLLKTHDQQIRSEIRSACRFTPARNGVYIYRSCSASLLATRRQQQQQRYE